MRTYTVHVHPDRFGEDRVIFTKDGFAWLAFLVPLIWFLVKRLWLAAGFFFAFSVVLTLIGEQFGVGETAIGIIALAVQIVIGFEANDLYRARLEQQGYELASVVQASSLFDAERLFFRDHPDVPAAIEPKGAIWPKRFGSVRRRAASTPEVLGLFPAPDRHRT